MEQLTAHRGELDSYRLFGGLETDEVSVVTFNR
jgi:hypothetical protein